LLVALIALGGAAVVRTAWRADPDAATDGRVFAQAAAFDLHSPVWSLAFSPDRDTLASSTVANEVWLIDDARGVRTVPRRGRMDAVRSLAFSPDGRVLAIGGPGQVVRLVDPSSASDLGELEPDDGDNASQVAIAPDGRYLAAGGCSGTVTIWDRVGRRRLGALAGRDAITALAFAPDGSTLAAGDETGRVRLWVVPGRKTRIIQASDVPFSGVTALAYSPDGASLASTSKLEDCVRLWDPSDGRLRATIPSGAAQVRALAFSPDGALLVMAKADGGATLWGLAEGRELAQVRANGCALQCVAFSADGRSLATGGTDGRVRVWDVARAAGGRSAAALRPFTTRAEDDSAERLPGEGAGFGRPGRQPRLEQFGDDRLELAAGVDRIQLALRIDHEDPGD
jgi:WD40 repeat protein